MLLSNTFALSLRILNIGLNGCGGSLDPRPNWQPVKPLALGLAPFRFSIKLWSGKPIIYDFYSAKALMDSMIGAGETVGCNRT